MTLFPTQSLAEELNAARYSVTAAGSLSGKTLIVTEGRLHLAASLRGVGPLACIL